MKVEGKRPRWKTQIEVGHCQKGPESLEYHGVTERESCQGLCARCATLHRETVATDEKGDTSIEEAILFHNGKSWSKSRIRSEWGTPEVST